MRYTNHTSIEQKDAMFVLLMKLRSITFLATSKIAYKNINSQKFTPDRANQIQIALTLNQFPEMDPIMIEKSESFMKDFYSTCDCRSKCFLKVDFTSALETYNVYSQKDRNTKLVSLGALATNMKVILEDNRNSG